MMSISVHIIANQSSYHDDKSTLQCFIRVFCPQLIRNVWSRRPIDSSSIIAHPVNYDLHTWERSWKCYAKNSMYIYIYIYDALDNRYGFSISVQPGIDCTTFQFLFMKSLKKKCFSKFSKVGRFVIGWRSGWPICIFAHVITAQLSWIVPNSAGIILYMHPTNERWRYDVTSSLIGWAHSQIDPCNGLLGSFFIWKQHVCVDIIWSMSS